MSKHGTALSIGHFSELAGAVIKALPRDIDPEIALNWANNGAALKKVLAKALCPPVEEKPDKLLELMTAVAVSGSTRFIAADHFRVDTSRQAKVKIAFLWDSFSTHFVPKVEDGVPAGDLKVHKLLEPSVDKLIRTELGEDHETYLADLWAMLEKQPNGEEGPLLVNGWANIFYINDMKGNTWAVGVDWYSGGGGWVVGANSVSSPGRWGGGDRLVSR